MKGSFEEQATALHALVGRPVMTANEGRARLNLPQVTDDPSADQLAEQQGGPSNNFVTPPSSGIGDSKLATVIDAHTHRQRARLAKFAAIDRPAAFEGNAHRYTRELESDLTPILTDPAAARALAVSTVAKTLTKLHTEAIHEW